MRKYLLILVLLFGASIAQVEVIDNDLPESLPSVPSSNNDVIVTDDVTQALIPPPNNPGFIHAFIASISVILVSEIGDKTFFIAAIMSMTNSRLIVFGGAIFALALMTVMSAVFGIAAQIIPAIYTHYISIGLFVIFGLKMLWDGYKMSPNVGKEEMEEVQSDLRERENKLRRDLQVKREELPKRKAINEEPNPNDTRLTVEDDRTRMRKSNRVSDDSGTDESIAEESSIPSSSNNTTSSVATIYGGINEGLETKPENHSDNSDVENGDKDVTDPNEEKHKQKLSAYIKFRVLMQAFTMTFVAEWGDRSQITTIVLSATEDIFGVIAGGVLGHAFCTGLAVIGGRILSNLISVRAVTIIGGIVFLIFALTSYFIDPLKF
ncbi:TMEM165 family protein [Megaselia abdita]